MLEALSVGFKFIPRPHVLKDKDVATFTVYANAPKEHLANFVHNTLPYHLEPRKPLGPTQAKVSKAVGSDEWHTLHQKHLLMPTDKNLDVSIVSYKWMLYWTEKLLTNKEVFEEIIPPLPIEEICSQFSRKLPYHVPTMQFLETQPVPKHVAKFYPLPRPHKGLPIKARPITSLSHAVTTTLSNALDSACQQLLFDIYTKLKKQNRTDLFTVVTNTEQFIQRTNDFLKQDPESIYRLTAYDFTDMYTNINTQESIDSIEWLIESFLEYSEHHIIKVVVKKSRPNKDDEGNLTYPEETNRAFSGQPLANIPFSTEISIPVGWIGRLLSLVLREFSYVESLWLPGRQFRQTKGYAMGTNCAPPGSNLTLLAREIAYYSSMERDKRTAGMLTRYIDDMIVAHLDGINPEEELKKIYTPLGLTFSRGPTNPNPFNSTQRAIYLDLQFPELQMEHFRFGIYTKPKNAYGLFHKDSYAPCSISKGVVIGAAKRILCRNSDLKNADADWVIYCKLLNRQGYTNRFIMQTLHKYLQKEKTPDNAKHFYFSISPKKRTNKKDSHQYFVVADYLDTLPAHKLNPLINQHLPVVPGRKGRIGLAYRTHPNLLQKSHKYVRFLLSGRPPKARVPETPQVAGFFNGS